MKEGVILYVVLFVGIILGSILLCLWYGLRSRRSNRRRRSSIESQTYELVATPRYSDLPPPYEDVMNPPPTYEDVMEDPDRYMVVPREQPITTGRVIISSM